MKRILIVALLALALALLPVLSLAEFDSAGLIDWFNESNTWMTVANGHWSSDPADKITHEELEQIFSMATKQQNAVHWTPYFFIVVEDLDEQLKIIGDYWGPVEDMATEATVTVLVMSDQLLTEEEGHISPYSGYYMNTAGARFDAGLACGVLGVAAASLGYQTHYFGTITGEYAPHDLADGKYQSMSRYVKEEYQRVWGFPNTYGEDFVESSIYPVAGNCVFIDAIVIGKPAAGETIETWGTNHGRPNNWVIWDGVPNDEPSPSIAAATAAATAEAPAEEAAEEAAVELAENEYLGEATGMEGPVKVKITVEDGKITAIEIVAQQESMPQTALDDIPAAILAAQSVEVDGISGSTITSDAIKAAVADAMAQAGL